MSPTKVGVNNVLTLAVFFYGAIYVTLEYSLISTQTIVFLYVSVSPDLYLYVFWKYFSRLLTNVDFIGTTRTTHSLGVVLVLENKMLKTM